MLTQPAIARAQTVTGTPRLDEFEAKRIASDYGNVRDVVSKHFLLERRAEFDEAAGVWEVTWTNPLNNRRIVAVEVNDATGAVLSVSIRPEAYDEFLPLLTEQEAISVARDQSKVQDELAGRPEDDARANLGDDHVWTVSFYSGNDTVAEVLVDDNTGLVNEVRVGPQVAWQMARGYDGAFGRIINEPYIWLPLCLIFLAPFIDLSRPLRMLHLDLLVLLSFTVSHYFFNLGEIFTSVPLAYPPLIYIFLRMGYMAVRRQPSAAQRRPRLHLNFSPRIMFIGLLALLLFRLTINIADSNVVDVGYSGVIGAHRILEGTAPYGNFPSDNANGDTYGPLDYIVYVPFEKVLPWSGEWDDLPAAHATAIFFDLLAVAGMYYAGRRLGRHRGAEEAKRFGLALAWGWAAFPYTTFVLNCNVNDSIVAAFLIWGFVLLETAPLAGLMLGLATQIKFFPAMLGPLWASFPRAFRGWWRRILFIVGFGVAIALTLPVIFLGDGAFSTFWERSVTWQLGRDSPFSIWGQHMDALAGAQRLGQYVLVVLALAVYFWPPRKTMLNVAAASAALITGFEMLQTHWFYLYIPWFFPLALIALLGWTVRNPERNSVASSDA